MDNTFKSIVINRLKKLVIKLLSLTFLSWVVITILLKSNGQELDLNYYIFTAALVGIKVFGSKPDINQVK